MINYFWIIEDILIKRPKNYKIILHSDMPDVVNILQMMSIYFSNKCDYNAYIDEINKFYEKNTIIKLEMKWL